MIASVRTIAWPGARQSKCRDEGGGGDYRISAL